MSTALKHQPATPLPWRTERERDGVRQIKGKSPYFVARVHGPFTVGDPAGVGYEGAEANAAYIAHAANAYPKLVRALENVALAFGDGEREIAAKEAAVLLRELGEAE